MRTIISGILLLLCLEMVQPSRAEDNVTYAFKDYEQTWDGVKYIYTGGYAVVARIVSISKISANVSSKVWSSSLSVLGKVAGIDEKAFYNGVYLTTVTFSSPSYVTFIGTKAFMNCERLSKTLSRAGRSCMF